MLATTCPAPLSQDVRGKLYLMDTEENLSQKWKQFKKYRTISIISFCGFGCFAVLIAVIYRLENSYLNTVISWIYLPTLIVLAIAFCISVILTTTWKCPQCGKPYSAKFTGLYLTNWPFLNECRHCGLPFGSIEFKKSL